MTRKTYWKLTEVIRLIKIKIQLRKRFKMFLGDTDPKDVKTIQFTGTYTIKNERINK